VTYEYECLKCGDRFEWEQAITDGPLGLCIRPVADSQLEGLKLKWTRETRPDGSRVGTATLVDGPTLEVCGGQLRRLIFAPAFALKGGGWAASGYSK
jgi:predicted nucleic acid-binding Zn ribbon protein